ncbi:hypothetical protein M2451_001744 [Dysgonomonas sp. PFB1-18]|uniref:DUF2975 domain-containing protein n=1 Tax=unclassified Dysgonomonas TaxID=2630389 RepID=UPI002474EE92|nr:MULTISPECIES: DUF2975 domain-containing protein [unclassified Dysgonomonas]MDH6309173.1 hypothetical protein [Dysgonomonas sp. PF1-14]MDH6338947.1 hypothetical protein [Dysgonomonas sp. PF1-16]MDH6380422.1 hypothetical protein [Dysgonomonas sp. PFB1-18]MDH6397775.1 hypothetical protein [Dysgonomonas sp. PF1-23]
MNTRIKIYCIILSIIYILIILGSMPGSIEGFIKGSSDAERQNNLGKSIDVLYITVEPKDGYYAYPEKMKSKTGSSDLSLSATTYHVESEGGNKELSVGLIIFKYFSYILLFFAGMAMIASPFIFYKILRSVTKNKIIDDGVISNIRLLGYFLVYIFVTSTLFQIVNYLSAKQLIEFTDYKITFELQDIGILILAFVTLLLAEILKVSLNLKEEQDLTI